MPRLLMPRRRLFQVSVFDLLLAMTAVIALLVNHQASAPRALIYTAGFFGGLNGTAIAMNGKQPRVWQVFLLGSLVGIGAGWVAAIYVEVLSRGYLFNSGLRWHSPRPRVSALQFATPFGIAGGLVASVLYVLTCALSAQMSQPRECLRLDGDTS